MKPDAEKWKPHDPRKIVSADVPIKEIEKVVDWLNEMEPDRIRDLFANEGVTGITSEASGCVTAEYFRKKFPGCDAFVNCDGIVVYVKEPSRPKGWESVDLPISGGVIEFLDEFDAGMYPELITPQHPEPVEIVTDDGTAPDERSYTKCLDCDHFAEEDAPGRLMHLENGEQEFDHEPRLGNTNTMGWWKKHRPDLFFSHPDGLIGPNSGYHSREGKVDDFLRISCYTTGDEGVLGIHRCTVLLTPEKLDWLLGLERDYRDLKKQYDRLYAIEVFDNPGWEESSEYDIAIDGWGLLVPEATVWTNFIDESDEDPLVEHNPTACPTAIATDTGVLWKTSRKNDVVYVETQELSYEDVRAVKAGRNPWKERADAVV